ncbi:MAG: hypothetical protein L6Q66_07855 [Bacteroidia bacterium]|nr:hypothetical protein [Bacteroidia bacterium]
MHKVTFFPLGNADCCLIELENNKNLMFDYAHCREAEDDNDLRIDLKSKIQDKMEEKELDYLDYVAFTHADDDHIRGFSDIFYLEFAAKYQEGERIKINELWVPASVIVEKGLTGEAKILQSEARYRLKNKSRIKIFSRPSMLKEWFEENELNPDNFSGFLIDAGQIIPGLNLKNDKVEIFVHSPFAKRNEEEVIDRNLSSIVVQLKFEANNENTYLILGADTPYENWQDIVNITKKKNREEKLKWDIFKLPHHCSYLSLSSEKGKTKTEPRAEVMWLFEQGNEKCKIVSTSKIIENEDTDLPPHYQAANYYKELVKGKNGEFLVTMEHPKKSKPEPIEIEIDSLGCTVLKRNIGTLGILTNRPAPRAGK